MDVIAYLKRKQELKELEPQYRNLCLSCRQPDFSCYCPQIQKFDPKIRFVILIHPIEDRRRIATGRMSHLCLEGSQLIKGQDFTHNKEVNKIIADSSLQKMILYPGRRSTNLSQLSNEGKLELFDRNKELVLFVIDGTWNTARKTMHLSKNLQSLPQICFTPSRPSTFRVRKQPNAMCFSTIEAIHQTIELCADQYGYDISTHQHQALLDVFDHMVERQLPFTEINKSNPRYPRRSC